tara:strand:+ start:174 stop:782 length:609 start_codon:yes stop_codon:yes gene_type:complete
MALDKKFLRYKLERIKNKRIFKDQDSETKKRIRKENAKLAKEEADAIHSYLTGEDEIDALDNKSYLENRLPGSLFVGRGNQLNIRQVQTNPKSKKSRLSRLLKRFKTVAKANIDEAKSIIILKKIFDKLNIILNFNEIKTDGTLNTGGYKTREGNEEYTGITDEFRIADVDIDDDGNIVQNSQRRALLIVKNGLIVEVRRLQ